MVQAGPSVGNLQPVCSCTGSAQNQKSPGVFGTLFSWASPSAPLLWRLVGSGLAAQPIWGGGSRRVRGWCLKDRVSGSWWARCFSRLDAEALGSGGTWAASCLPDKQLDRWVAAAGWVIALSCSLPVVLKWFELFVVRNDDRNSEFWLLELFLGVLWVPEWALQSHTVGPQLFQVTAALVCLVCQSKRHLFLDASHGNSTCSLEEAGVTHAPWQVQRHRSLSFPPSTPHSQLGRALRMLFVENSTCNPLARPEPQQGPICFSPATKTPAKVMSLQSPGPTCTGKWCVDGEAVTCALSFSLVLGRSQGYAVRCQQHQWAEQDGMNPTSWGTVEEPLQLLVTLTLTSWNVDTLFAASAQQIKTRKGQRNWCCFILFSLCPYYQDKSVSELFWVLICRYVFNSRRSDPLLGVITSANGLFSKLS